MVRSLTQLREKALIFENNLDDKIIELMKLQIFTQLQNADPDILIEDIQADFPSSGQIRFLVKIPENQLITIAFDQEMYGKIKEKLLKKNAASGNMDFVINREWAEKQMAEEEWVECH